MKNYLKTSNLLFKNGWKYKTKSRTISLSPFGSTIDATRYPQAIINKQYKISPWPYPSCKPENKGWRVLQLNCFIEFIRSIKQITINILKQFIQT